MQFVWRVILIALLLVLAVAEYFLRLMEMKIQGRLDATSHEGARAVLGPFRRLLAGLSRGVRTLVELLSAMVAAWGATTDAVNLDEARRTRIFLDLSLAILRGILVDDIIAKGFGSIDHLESHWAKPWKDSDAKTLVVGIHYDLVVLGISIGGLAPICRQLIDHFPEWRSMIEKVDTVATQAMQLWLSPTIGDLGWTFPSPLVVNYEDPASNWLDASQVIPHEPLRGSPVRSVAYFCSALEDARDTPQAVPHTCAEDQRLAVQHTHQRWIEQHAGFLWPAMANIAGRPGVVNWDLLHDPLNRVGPARLAGQYFRANVQPSDRFVLSSTGATAFRLPPNDSKVGNLMLAGDWTKNGFNCGCVEATVISGLLCSRAISGSPGSFFGEHPFGMFNL